MFRLKTLAAATLSLASFSVLAGGGDVHDFSTSTEASVLTRDAVRAEVRAAIARDELSVGEAGVRFAPGTSVRSRAEVRAELREAGRLGLLSGTEAGSRPTTTAQEAQIRAAGQRAGALASMTAPRG